MHSVILFILYHFYTLSYHDSHEDRRRRHTREFHPLYPVHFTSLLRIFDYNGAMSQIRISSRNFFHNISQIAAKTQSIEKIALVLKDNAYGHGLKIMAELARKAGVRHAVVRRVCEAEAIGGLFETVLVLSELPQETPPEDIHITINSMEAIDRIPKDTTVELKIDTGMHRNGIEPGRFAEALEKISGRGLKLAGVMTHYRSADEMGSEFFWQKKRFDLVREEAVRIGVSGIRWHSCNSAALFRMSGFDEDIARIGIAAYGCLKMPSSFFPPDLMPVMSLWADKIATRELRAGERVGYGGEGVVAEDCRISSYDIGYGDGWPRREYVLPDGRSLVGRVSMDTVCIEGDEERICIFDDASKAAEQLGTIGYEVMTGLSASVKRVVV